MRLKVISFVIIGSITIGRFIFKGGIALFSSGTASLLYDYSLTTTSSVPTSQLTPIFLVETLLALFLAVGLVKFGRSRKR